jgi:hypothetical protein
MRVRDGPRLAIGSWKAASGDSASYLFFFCFQRYRRVQGSSVAVTTISPE